MVAIGFKVGVQFDSHVKSLFSKNSWGRALKASMIEAGRGFIVARLPLRFSSFAVERLGYNAKKLTKQLTRDQRIRIAIAMMRRDGAYDRLVRTYCARWGGWDPTLPKGPSSRVWLEWVTAALKAGKIKRSKSGQWQTARKTMRDEVLRESRIVERVRLYAIDEYVDQFLDDPVPLIASGWLYKNHQRLARAQATAPQGNGVLTIPIPRENRVNKQVNKVLGATTAEEAEMVGAEVWQNMEAFIAKAEFKTTRKGTMSARMGGRDRSRIAFALRSATVKSHRNRTTKHSPRKAG